MSRSDSRLANELRKIKLKPAVQKDPEGSVLIEWGNTHVICSVIIEDRVPQWMQGSSGGWLTAEYNMLPGCSNKRIQRDKVRSTGRTHEIQRLIGRSLRAAVNLEQLNGRTIQIDCDVIQADGGTRVASITGAYMALRLALFRAKEKGLIRNIPSTTAVAAVSLGKVGGEAILDLNYEEDVRAEVDANLVMNEKGQLIEVQATAEKGFFSKAELDTFLTLADGGLQNLFQLQKQYLKDWGIF